jgi:hypothetical protein
MIKAFKFEIFFFIILVIQFINFYDINCICLEKNLNRSTLTTTSKVMTSLQLKEKVNDTVSKTTTTTTTLNNIHHTSLESTISTPRIIVSSTIAFGSNQESTTNPFKCKNLSTLNYYPYQFLNPSVLQYSNKFQQMKLFPSLNSNVFCSCASICANNLSCNYFFSTISATSIHNCILYRLNGINSSDVRRGIYFIQDPDGQITSGFNKNWLNPA